MARLAEVLSTKSGKWLSVGDVIRMPLRITEDLGAEYDIRIEESGKFYCIQVSTGSEVKDLHVPKGALRAIAGVMPQEGSWKGCMFTIDAVTGKGYQTKTHVSRYYEHPDPAAQQRIDQPVPGPQNVSPNNIPPDPRAEAPTAILEALRGMAAGVHDSRFEQFVHDTLTAKGIIASVSEVTTGLKYSGRIRNDNGCWKVV